jgi:uncharacterized membrane protein YccC
VAGVLARIIMVLVVVGVVFYGAERLHDNHTCSTEQHRVLTVLRFRGDITGGFQQAVHRLASTCRDRTPLAIMAANAVSSGRPDVGAALARVVTETEPENRTGWLALALALQKSDPAAAAAARAKAHALDPRRPVSG